MKRLVTVLCFATAVLSFTSAFALDLQRKGPNHETNKMHVNLNGAQAVFGCDDDIFYNAYYQATDDRFGNLFDFGGGAVLSEVAFAHYGFGFSGPYNYNLEIWDPTSCTFVVAKNNLVAADAAGGPVAEDVLTCGDNIFLAGTMLVAIDPNTCLASNDCYPDLLFDDQLNVACPMIINNVSTGPVCSDVSQFSGPFLLRVATDQCPTPARTHSWGQLKAIYR
jgi:hypothetical protein